MTKNVSRSTFDSQGRQINNLEYRINQTNGAIYTVNQRINSLKQQLSDETVSKNNAYNTKEEWRSRLDELKRLIRVEKAKISILETERDELIRERDRLQDILNASDEDHRTEITTGIDLSNTSNAKMIQNIEMNNTYYSDMQRQNKTLYNTIRNLKTDLTTYDKKTTTEANNTSSYEILHKGLLYVYYIAAIICIYLIYSKQYITNKYAFIFIIALIAFYPYYILNVEMYIYRTFAFLWALLKGIPYSNE